MNDEQSQWQLKAEFCSFIDRLLKVSKPQDQFLYYDLIQPSKSKLIEYIFEIVMFNKCILFSEQKDHLPSKTPAEFLSFLQCGENPGRGRK